MGPTIHLLVGHVLDQLRALPDASVQCCVTSPPYWGLRDYSRCGCAIASHSGFVGLSGSELGQGVNTKVPSPNCPKCHGTGKDDSLTVVWDAKDGCEHEWGDAVGGKKVGRNDAGNEFRPGRSDPDSSIQSQGSFCLKCGAWRGQLGLEPTPDLYVQHIVQVFQEVKRVLRDDGTLWLNMGDCYASTGNDRKHGGFAASGTSPQAGVGLGNRTAIGDIKQKNLVGMPWRVAFALQADGWWLRSDIIWAKPNPMPESVTDRPTKAHEYVFLLTKRAQYFYDADAVREANQDRLGAERLVLTNRGKSAENYSPRKDGKTDERWKQTYRTFGRNLRSVWTIATQPYPEAHFATFPEALVVPCIKAGTSEKGCCATCGAAWVRVVDAKPNPSGTQEEPIMDRGLGGNQTSASLHRNARGVYREAKTIGFRPTCDHGGEPVPCVVLDPFAGSGTVGKVARSLGRSAILIEIKEEYAELARKRTDMDHRALEEFRE